MKKIRKAQRFTVVLERDEDGFYVASIPALKGCHTQGRSLPTLDLVGVQQLEISA